MAKIKFETGQIVNFEGTPTQADVDEVATHLGMTKQSSVSPEDTRKKPNYLERVGTAFDKARQDIASGIKEGTRQYQEGVNRGGVRGELSATGGLLRSGLRTAGSIAESAFSPITEAPIVKPTLGKVGELVSKIPGVERVAQIAERYPKLAKDVSNVIDIATLGTGKTVEQPLKIAGEKAITKTAEKTGDVIGAYRAKVALEDAKKVDAVVGAIAQGKKLDIPRVKKALSSINTEGVKTYDDLVSTLEDKITNISTKLDEVLDTKKETKKLKDLSITTKIGDQAVTHNYVKDALDELDSYYTATNDVAKKARIAQMKAKASKEGLTIKEVNNLARLHGTDLNAYNANGELASGLSRIAAENTRAGLKGTARRQFGDEVFTAADKEISNLIRARDLAKKQVEAVNKLRQKIINPTLGQRAGKLFARILDLSSGGILKGSVNYFIPRGEGLKTLNALDLEKSLERNLKKLQKAAEPGLFEETIIERLEDILREAKMPPLLPKNSPTKPLQNYKSIQSAMTARRKEMLK